MSIMSRDCDIAAKFTTARLDEMWKKRYDGGENLYRITEYYFIISNLLNTNK